MNSINIEKVPALPDINPLYISPILILVAGLLITIVLNLLFPRRKLIVQISSIVTVICSLLSSIINFIWFSKENIDTTTGASALGINSITVLVTMVFGFLLLAVFMLSFSSNKKEKFTYPEYYFLVLLSGIGMYTMAYARDLMVMFVSLELMSIPLYVLAGSGINRIRGREASIKYFLMGAFASGFMIYGMSMVFGAFGSLNYKELLTQVSIHSTDNFILIGMVLVFVGMFFKLALVPFHSWAPDVYQGSPTLISGFMACGVKTATFSAAFFLISSAFPALYDSYKMPIGIIAVATMVMGNLMALNQTGMKRLLAYSSITHAGYISLGLLVPNGMGMNSMIYYLISYTIATFGAFLIVHIVQSPDKNEVEIKELNGLSSRNPWLALLMLIILASLAGIPPTVGFSAKLILFFDVIKAGYWPLALVAVLASIVSIFYYLKIVLAMFMKDSSENQSPFVLTTGQWIISTFTGLGSLILGIIPFVLTFLFKLTVNKGI